MERRLEIERKMDSLARAKEILEVEERLLDARLVQPEISDAVEKSIESQKGYIGVQGKAGELIAILSGNRFDLNELKHDLPMKGGNFPVYDNVGDRSVASVKVRGLNEAVLSEQTAQQYLRDFRIAIGEADSYRFDKAASLLFDAKERHLIPIPEGMGIVTDSTKMKDYLRNHAELQIPADHMAQVQEALRADVWRFPEGYGLSGKELSTEKVDRLARRMQPLAVSTKLLRQEIEIHMMKRRVLMHEGRERRALWSSK